MRVRIIAEVNALERLASEWYWVGAYFWHYTPQGGSVLDRLHQPIHSLFLPFDGSEQFELCSAAVKVVFVAAHFVIGIALQIVRQESDALLERHQFAGEDKVLLLGFR